MARHVQRIASAELRRIFNDRRLWAKVETGELIEKVIRSGHPAPHRSGQPFCTQSQMVGYYEAGRHQRVALVHQYLRPDGKIGGSGRPDPKAVLDGDTLYLLAAPSA